MENQQKMTIQLMGVYEGTAKNSKTKYHYISVFLGRGFNQDTARIFINQGTYNTLKENWDKWKYMDISNYITYNYNFNSHTLTFVFDLEEELVPESADLPF